MAASPSSSSSSTAVSARADTTSRKRPAVDLSLVDARLDELFASPEKDNAEEEVSARADSKGNGTFQMLTHDRITIRPQVRQSFPADEMAELEASIHELRAQNGGIEGSGILQALLVTPEGDGFRLVAGERRYRASQSEGVPLLPCVVVGDVSESAIRLLQLTENALRTPPPIVEESLAIEEAMNEEGLSIRDMARLLGKDKSYVEVRVNLRRYPLDVQEMVSARADTLRHARHIASVEDEELRASLIAAVRDEGIGEREVKRRIEAALHPEQEEEEVDASSGASSATQESTGVAREGKTSATSKEPSIGTPSLRGALRATSDAIDRLRRAVLSEEERQKARDARDSLRAMVEELDEILG